METDNILEIKNSRRNINLIIHIIILFFIIFIIFFSWMSIFSGNLVGGENSAILAVMGSVAIYLPGIIYLINTFLIWDEKPKYNKKELESKTFFIFKIFLHICFLAFLLFLFLL